MQLQKKLLNMAVWVVHFTPAGVPVAGEDEVLELSCSTVLPPDAYKRRGVGAFNTISIKRTFI